jgi:hypothetical protein
MNPEQVQEIARLRALNLSPKQIAKKLGLRPAEVTEFIRQAALESALAERTEDGLPPLKNCLINENAARRLLESGKDSKEDGTAGMAQVIVIRKESNRYLWCSYLVDYWCLGVKDAMGPKKIDRSTFEEMLGGISDRFGQEFREITLEQARAIVYGANCLQQRFAPEYAAKFGLQPHRDFEKAKAHLGEPGSDYPAIEFGRNGKPFFVAGPYDNAPAIIARLRTTAGEGNFGSITPF